MDPVRWSVLLSSALAGMILLVGLSIFVLTRGASGAPVAACSPDPVPLGLSPYLPVPGDNQPSAGKVSLGRRLFFDEKLSGDGSVSCATCHQPARAFADNRPVAIGIDNRLGRRNTPSLLNIAYSENLFWDGRSSSLEEQVLLPLVNPQEMGGALPAILSYLRNDTRYPKQFGAAFGEGQITVERLAKALASYQRSLLSGGSPFDRFKVLDEPKAFSAKSARGYALFRGKARCAFCHEEPLFTDGLFHNTGVGWQSTPRDLGRYEESGRPEDLGRFKTPSLRNVALTAPYMHDGSIATLKEVIAFYSRGGGTNPHLDPAVKPLGLSAEERAELLSFLQTLTAAQ